MRFASDQPEPQRAAPATLRLLVNGVPAESQEAINQALILAVSGLMRAQGTAGFAMKAASPAGTWQLVEISVAPAAKEVSSDAS